MYKFFIDDIINQTKSNIYLSKCRINNIDIIYAIPDIHGDYEVLLDVLSCYNIIDIVNDNKYDINNIILKKSLKNIVIVQTGDIMDQYREDGKYNCFQLHDDLCLKLLIKLKKESLELDNVHIVLLYGNHDITNIFRCYGQNHFINDKELLEYMNNSWLYSYGEEFNYLKLSDKEQSIIHKRNKFINDNIDDIHNMFLSGVIVNDIMFSHSFITKQMIDKLLYYSYQLYCYKNNIIFSNNSEIFNGNFWKMLKTYNVDILYFINCLTHYILKSIIYENNIDEKLYNSLWIIKQLFNERKYNNEKLQTIIKQYNDLSLFQNDKKYNTNQFKNYITDQIEEIIHIINTFDINNIVLGHVSISSEPRRQIINIKDKKKYIYYNDIMLSRAFIVKNKSFLNRLYTTKKHLLIFSKSKININKPVFNIYTYQIKNILI